MADPLSPPIHLPRPSREIWKSMTAVSLLLWAGMFAYQQSFEIPFLFDDIPTIRDNPDVHQFWPPWPAWTSRANTTGLGRPVLNWSLAGNYQWHGMAVRGYHIFNLAAHLATACLLWALIQRTLLLSGIPAWLRASARWIAWGIALVWTVHPLCSAAVLYIVQRGEILCALFYLGTLYSLLRAATSSGGIARFWSASCATSCLLAVLTKEVAVSIPLAAWLYDRAFLAGSFRAALRARGKLYLALCSSWLVIVWILISTGWRNSTATTASFIQPLEYARTQGAVVLTYFKLCLWPQPLIFDYGVFVTTDPTVSLPAMAIVGALLAGTGWLLWRCPRLGFLAASIFLILAPTSSIVPIVTHTAAEHRMYLPAASLICLVFLAGISAWSSMVGNGLSSSTARFSLSTGLGITILVGSAFTCAALTRQRSGDYRSVVTLWEDTVSKRPNNPRAYFNLGTARQDAGQYEAALRAFEGAIAAAERNRNPYNQIILLEALVNRAATWSALGQQSLALRELNRAAALFPEKPAVLVARGKVQGLLGNHRQAIADFTAALALNPREAEAYVNRAVGYYQLREFDSAWQDVAAARRAGGQFQTQFLQQLHAATGRRE